MKNFLDNYVEMPDRMVDQLVRFLAQGKGRLSVQAREKEFSELTEEEVAAIEGKYREVFGDGDGLFGGQASRGEESM